MTAFDQAWGITKEFERTTSDSFTEMDFLLFAHTMDPNPRILKEEEGYEKWPTRGSPRTQEEIDAKRLVMDYPITGIKGGLTPHEGSLEEKLLAAGASSASGSPFSWPSKMPGPAFNTPTDYCQAGHVMRNVPGSVCENCNVHYENNYGRGVVQNALQRRYNRMMSNPEEWGRAMVSLIPAYSMMSKKKDRRNPVPMALLGNFPSIDGKPGYMRWHDAGDLQGPQHLALLSDIARATPTVNHWIPTKEPKFVRQYLKAGGEIPENLIVRISRPMVGQGPLPEDHANVIDHPQVKQSTVGRSQLDPNYKGKVCPASMKGGSGCLGEECNACWRGDFDNIDYELETDEKGADPFSVALSPNIVSEIYDNYMNDEESFNQLVETDLGQSIMNRILGLDTQ